MTTVTQLSRPLYFRTTTKEIQAKEVEKGDRLLGMEVSASGPDDQKYIWRIVGRTVDESGGFQLRVTEDHLVTVERTRLVGDNECRSCGRTGIKYSARHLCNTCYQREYRAQRA
jgi:hypothetical protein